MPGPHHVSIPVAWGEMDALNHVNNVAYFRYLETARVEFIRSLGVDVSDRAKGVGFILQHAECRFRRPVVFPDTLTIATTVLNIEADRFTLEHTLTSTAQSQVVAIGKSTIVTYDYPNACKMNIPADVLATLNAARNPGSAR
jgi:acyl-CoA thioester hydrolase